MGEIEKDAKRKGQWGYVQSAVLATVGVAGVLAVAAVAPNALQLLGGFGRKKYQFNFQSKSALSRLVNKGYIRFVEKGNVKYAEITMAGRRVLDLEVAKTAQRIRRKRWDKRWRMVIFDIPERFRNLRTRLRVTMQEMEFLRLQDSVWVFPYDCEELIQLLKTDLHVGKYVLYAVVESIENDKHIREHFKLPKS